MYKLLSDDINGTRTSNSQKYLKIKPPLDNGIMRHPMSGVPIIFTFGYCHQLTHVSMKVIHGVIASTYTDSSGISGRIYSRYFINISPSVNTYSMVVIMDKVIRQIDPEIFSCL